VVGKVVEEVGGEWRKARGCTRVSSVSGGERTEECPGPCTLKDQLGVIERNTKETIKTYSDYLRTQCWKEVELCEEVVR
jgi:hypothetical protein